MTLDLVATLAAQTRIEHGVNPRVVLSRTPGLPALVGRGEGSLSLSKGAPASSKSPRWTQTEDAYLRDHLGLLSEDEMARALGRTPVAVHLRWKRDLGLTAPSKRPNEVTAEQIGIGLGVDGKAVHRWIDSGLLPGRRLPLGAVVRVVERGLLLNWILNPDHWVYFKPERVGVERRARTQTVDWAWWRKVRGLLDHKRQQWGDDWWTSGQVARHFGIDHRLVRKHCAEGRLAGVQWNNWRIRRSHALSHVFYVGKGAANLGRFTPAAEAFLILARAVGHSFPAIERMMKLGNADAHYKLMCRRGRVKSIIRKFGLPVKYNARTGRVQADLAQHAGRFPKLALKRKP